MKRKSNRLHKSNKWSVSALVQPSSCRCTWYSCSEYTGTCTVFKGKGKEHKSTHYVCKVRMENVRWSSKVTVISNRLCSSQPSYLVEAGKRVVLAFLCHPSPVVEYSSVPACWISKGHPLPGSHFFTAQLSFDRPVALSGITWQERWSISVDCILSYFIIIISISITKALQKVTYAKTNTYVHQQSINSSWITYEV